ncbi:MAG: peptidase M12A [Marteilia pararefringens]
MRSDRDDFVHYMPENTERAFRKQFEISTRTFDSSEPGQGSESVPYDYSSVMHYPAVAFSKNGLPTILPTNQKYERTLGQNAGPSFLDILNINRIYCDNKASVQGLWSKINSYCENDGYLDPKSKKRCICRDGFYGDKCQHIGSTKCGEKILLDDQVTEKRISFYSFVDDNSDTSCVWLIHNLSSDRKIIKIVSTDFEVPSTSANYCNLSWFEIRSDKPNDFESTSLTHLGARYCGEERHRINVLSREEKVMMLLQSSQDFGIVKLDLIVKII